MLCDIDIDNINLILKIEDDKKSEENTNSNNKVCAVKNTNKYKRQTVSNTVCLIIYYSTFAEQKYYLIKDSFSLVNIFLKSKITY